MTQMEFDKGTDSELPAKLSLDDIPASKSLVATIPEAKPAISSTELTNKIPYSIRAEDKKILSRIKLLLYTIGVLILAFIEVCIFFPSAIFPLIAFGVCAFIAAPFGAVLFFGSKLKISEKDEKTVLDSISRSEVNQIGTLCNQLSTGNHTEDAMGFSGKSFLSTIQTEIVATLTQLLPKLQASDSHRLNKGQREKLRYQLTKRKAHYDPAHIRFQVAILKALERIGVEEDLPTLIEIAYPNKNVVDLVVQTAAQECLPLLKARIASEKERTQLLRASSFTTLGTDELLRPARGCEDAEPDTLLRPSDRIENQ